jgi:septal ring factor EnvC (AmiA/AmiB activator)
MPRNVQVTTFKEIKPFDKRQTQDKLLRLLKRRLEISELRKEKVQLKRDLHKEIYNYSVTIEELQQQIDKLTLSFIEND